MFLEVEGDRLVNLTLMSRVELFHAEHKRYAVLWNAGVPEVESHIAYQYFTNPANRKFLMVPVGDISESTLAVGIKELPVGDISE